MPGDYAEFQMSAAILGVPHPTGYPFYILLGKLFTLLPVGDVAYRVNLSSAIYMAGAASMVYVIALRLSRTLGFNSRLAPLVGAAFFALAPTIWSMALVARSYALNALLVSGVIFALISWRHSGRPAWFYAACALIGLSMAHHGTTYLLLPAYGLYLIVIEVERRRGRGSGVGGRGLLPFNSGLDATLGETPTPDPRPPTPRYALGALAFLLGLSPMLFLVYRFVGGGPYYWGNPTTWKDFFSLITGGPFQNQVMGFGWGAQLERLAFGLNELAGQFTIVGILAGLVGLVVLWRYARAEAMLLSLMIVANFFFAMNYSLVGYLYFIPTYLIWSILIGVALAWLGHLVGAAVKRQVPEQGAASSAPTRGLQLRGLVPVLAVALLALAIYRGADRFSGIDQSGQTATRDEALALLNSAPNGASLYLDWEDIAVIRFYRLVYGMRPDLTLYTGDPADWAKWVYCDLTNGVPTYVGEFAGAQPPVIARDFVSENAPMGWHVLKATNSARYEIPPCGTCATCR